MAISNSRDLRQHDPLYPYLFILVTEGLRWMLDKANLSGYLEGWKIKNWSNENRTVIHLLFFEFFFPFFF